MSENLRGVFVANVTPFDASERFMAESLTLHLEWLAEQGVQGFVPCGTTGEGPTLSSVERRTIFQIARKVATEHKLRIIAGCNSNSTHIALDQVKEAYELGCDAALVITPYYNKPTSEGVLAHFTYLAEHTPVPLVLYNVPSRTNINLTPDLATKLLGHPNIVGIKEASGLYGQWLNLSRRINLESKAFLAGDDDAFAVILALGGAGIISASANIIPEFFVRIYKMCLSGNLKEAFEIQKRIQPLISALFLETNPSPVKCALKLMHRCEDKVRLPLVSVCPQTEAAIRAALSELEIE